MTRNDQLALVIRLACETEDRTDEEQRALLDLAWKCDQEHNQNTTVNFYRRDRRTGEDRADFVLQDLVTRVEATRDRDQRVLTKPNRWEATWERWERGE